MAVNRITDKADRIVTIASELENPKRIELTHFRGNMVELPVARLPIDLPIYRMNNGRTQVDQYQYLDDVDQPDDFFENGEENISAQKTQHRILLKLSKDDKGPIYQELERVATQRESLLLTSDGVVLNGNRRLAAMRDLFLNDIRTYASFSHLDAVILPKEANEQDLELLEAELQMAPETKLEYGWIERRLKLRRHADVMKIPRDQIKATYRFRREQEINVELQQLALAEEYLERYISRPHAYREVGQSEQIFKNLEKELRGKSGTEAEVRRLLGYLLVKEARNLGNRVYRYNPIFGKDFDAVMSRYAQEEGIDLTGTAVEDGPVEFEDDDDPLGGLGGEIPSPYEEIKTILDAQDKTEETAEKLSRVFESIKAEEKEKDDKQGALMRVQKINRALHDLDLSAAAPNTFGRIQSQLETILAMSKSLKGKIDEMVDGMTEAL